MYIVSTDTSLDGNKQYFTHRQQPDIPIQYAKQAKILFLLCFEKEKEFSAYLLKKKKKNVPATPKMMSYQLLASGQLQCNRKLGTGDKQDPAHCTLPWTNLQTSNDLQK